MDNYVEIDPEMKDTFGIPVLRINMTYGENEHNMVNDMADAAAEMLEAAGAMNVHKRLSLNPRMGDPRGGHRAHGQGTQDLSPESISADA